MSLERKIRDSVIASIETKQRALEGPLARRAAIAATLIKQTVRRGGRLLVAGNGGSQCDAMHFASELTGRFSREVERPGFSALSLPTNASFVTAWGNDVAYTDVFRREVEAHGRPGDCLVLISTSGRSPNVVAAKKQARQMGIITIALTGGNGGDLIDCDIPLIVDSYDIPRIQEVHIALIHAMCAIIDDPRVVTPPFGALLTDLDGTLAPTEERWPEIDRRFFSSIIGVEAWKNWTPTWLELRRQGVQLNDILRQLLTDHGREAKNEDVAALKRLREDFLLREYKDDLRPFPGASLLLRAARHMGIKVGIVSGMSPRIIEGTAALFGWEPDGIASTHEVPNNKPDPGVYRLGMERIAFEPSEQNRVLAVENELRGHQSASGALATCAFLPDTEERERAALEAHVPRTHNTLEEVLVTLLGI